MSGRSRDILKRVTWFCDDCGAIGVVCVARGALASEVRDRVFHHHRSTVPGCRGVVNELRPSPAAAEDYVVRAGRQPVDPVTGR